MKYLIEDKGEEEGILVFEVGYNLENVYYASNKIVNLDLTSQVIFNDILLFFKIVSEICFDDDIANVTGTVPLTNDAHVMLARKYIPLA